MGSVLGSKSGLRPSASTPMVYSFISSGCSSNALVARKRNSCCRVGALWKVLEVPILSLCLEKVRGKRNPALTVLNYRLSCSFFDAPQRDPDFSSARVEVTTGHEMWSQLVGRQNFSP